MRRNLLKHIIILFKLIFYACIVQASNLAIASDTNTGSQNIKDIYIELKTGKKSIVEAFKMIESKTEFLINYEEKDIDHSISIHFSDGKTSVAKILTDIATVSDLRFRQINQTINVMRSETKTKEKPPVEIMVDGVIITGKVTSSEDGNGLPGVNVIVKGSQTGTVTDPDGAFTIEAPSSESVLVFSSIGFTAQELTVGNRTTINITMSPDLKLLDEIVVVGYGEQKKVNMTGAVAAVSGDEIRSRPISSVSNGLQGMLPGVTITSATGLPGQPDVNFRIRGIGTIGTPNPLILIDGVEGNINLLNPDDIESVSVLKDAASAAIYGARGANGVILVTTKRMTGGEMKPAINFSGYYGIQTPTRLPEMANAMEYIEMDNEARANVGLPSNYPADAIERIVNGTDPDYFNNTDWVDAIYDSYAPQQNYNLSVSGKSPAMGYYLSYGYLDQDGLTVGNTTTSVRHNIRAKLNTKIANILELTANIAYSNREYATPSGGFETTGGAIYTAMRISPVIPQRFTDGGWGYGGGSANPVALLHDSGQNIFGSEELFSVFTGKLDFMRGWNATATYSFKKYNSLRQILSRTIHYYRPGTNEVWYTTNPVNKFENRDYNGKAQTLILQSNFDRTFGRHNISALGGFSQEWDVARNFTAERINLATEISPSLQFGSKEGMSNAASATNWAIRSGFGRLGYNFDGRYLFEANVRYDLSSRFHKDRRGGVFPSFSAGWRASEEGFFDPLKGIVDNLKVRASWGILGNQYVGSPGDQKYYPYLSIMEDVSVPNIGASPNVGFAEASLPNPILTWETIEMINVGLDLAFLRNRLNVTADWFTKDTEDILLILTYPSVLGIAPTEENLGAVKNTGWELDLRWNDRIGNDFTYGVSFNLSDVRNKITSLGGLQPNVGSYSIKRVGDPIDAFYGLVADGLASPLDFEGYDPVAKKYIGPKFPVLSADAGLVQPGDVKYKDISGDGKIALDDDRKVIGSAIPRYTFNFRGDVGWKGFDLSVILQGVGKADGYLAGASRHAYTDQSTYPQKIHLERWTPSNPNPNASYPRFTANYSYNQRFSTFWLEDASYLRVKNIQLGYTFRNVLTGKLNIDNCRVYFSGDNLFTLTDFFYAYDPESPVNSSGGYYPQVRTMVLGFNVTLK